MGNLRRIKKACKSEPPIPAQPPAGGGSERIELDRRELEAILERAKTAPISEEESAKLRAVVETLVFLTGELEKKHVSIQKLKHLLFGSTTESTRKVIEKLLADPGPQEGAGEEATPPGPAASEETPQGHGRHGADAYVGAETIRVPHESLQPGDGCPSCHKGTVYESLAPARLVRIQGQAPLGATVYELQKLRCHLCGEIFTATAPPNVGPDKYDAASAGMIALLKYGTGLPFNRLERLEGNLGIPLPAATQWDIVDRSGETLEPTFEELIRQGAQGQVVHNDDTGMKILALADRPREAADAGRRDRTGVFTSGIVSILGEHRIALFFTGRRHAGENLAAVLQQRARELDRPIQMCDALSRNLPDLPEEFRTIVAHCLAHGRRQFVNGASSFPDECLYVLELLKQVYQNDAKAKAQGMTAPQRLAFHQAHSQSVMEQLKGWLADQIEQRKVEPNSSLGAAINYMRNHWNELTLFLREPGAPLDNNLCERALKKAILHRKNAYFYKTDHGARTGDLFMSLIHTCELNGVNAFDYLTQLLQHPNELSAHPNDWMPWNYHQTLQRSAALGATDSPAPIR
jgi:transposase